MRDLQIRLAIWVQRNLEFIHRNEFTVEETNNELTFEWTHIVEHVPTVIGTMFN